MTDPTKRQIEFGYADLSQVKLHYATAGNGEKLVILLHGFPEFWYSWRHQLAALSDQYTVVAPDMRGFNLSEKPSSIGAYQIDKLAGDIVDLIGHFGHDKAALVGHDWGASVAWRVASKHPEKLSKLACLQVPPPAVWKKNQTLAQFQASWYMFFFQIPKLPEIFLSANDYKKLAIGLKTTTAKRGVFSDKDIELYKKAWRREGALTGALNYYRANILKRLFGKAPPSEKIKVPTLFIYGEKDHAILPETVQGVRDFIEADYTELRLPDAAHWSQLEAKEDVTAALRKFLTT